MGHMKFGNDATDNFDRIFEVFEFYNVLQRVTDMVNNICQVQCSWDFQNKESPREASVASTITYNRAELSTPNRVNNLYQSVRLI